MPKSLEETVMFTDEDEGFQELFDRLLAHSSTKQSVKMSGSKRPTRKDDPTDVDRPEPHEQREVLELRQVWTLLP